MAVSFTEDQQKVITLRNRNLLVSAAAGSGKTAVLVERIIRMITDKENPVDIDRLLVVTFTNAAAAEMRERIGLAINRLLLEDGENVHLQRQASLLHNAQITTIDSFCLFVIRNNFNDIGLDPGFRVADEGELRLLKQDVLQELLEERYQKKEERFLSCVEYFTGGSNDKLLEEYIGKLYEFSMSSPWPEDWIGQCIKEYKVTDDSVLEESQWCSYLVSYIQTILRESVYDLEFALRIAERPDGPYMYGETLEKEIEMLNHVLKYHSFSGLQSAFETISFGRLPSKKDESVNSLCREKVQQLRKSIKKQLDEIRTSLLALPLGQAAGRMKEASFFVEELLQLVLDFKERLDEKKRRENLIDFHDMEHFALEILLKKTEEGEPFPSPAAMEYREFFREIFIDEYQDSNQVQELLLESISGESVGRYNRFMVGDVKQSIYKFRQACPELFMEKYNCYSTQESKRQRIDLHKNFRSRPQVLESVNGLFGRIMRRDLGGVEYDSAAALYQGASFPENPKDPNAYDTEYLMIEKAEDGFSSAREQEAAAIARKIKDLYENLQVTDTVSGDLRPVRYSDMVILLRTTSGWAEEFKGGLEKEGIPAYVASRTGYFQAVEVKTLLQFLRVIDNPLQDIPLFGTLKSYFGGFTEEEIARIRKENKAILLYDELISYEGELKDKIQSFLNRLSRYRQKTVYTPIHKLIQEILSDTGYLDYVFACSAGEQKRANVEMLLTRAAAFENTSYYGLFHFLRYIEQLEKYEVDYGLADVLDENADVVRIMSIHKSKGLEFPVCFVAGLAKKFNMQDTSGGVIADMDMGLGVDYVDSDLRIRSSTLKKKAVALKMKHDILGEELRVLYVAMTRAKEKLILTALVPSLDKFRQELEQKTEFETLREEEEKVSFSLLSGAGCSLDFVFPCLDLTVEFVGPTDILQKDVKAAVREIKRKQELFDTSVGDRELTDSDNEIMSKLSKQMSSSYPYQYLSNLFVKTTVSELKKRSIHDLPNQSIETVLAAESAKNGALPEQIFTNSLFEEQETVPYIPSFLREEETLSGTDRGSAYHKVMELLDFHEVIQAKKGKEREAKIRSELDRFEAEGLLSARWRQSIFMPKLLDFFDSSLALRMTRAREKDMLYREQPFVLGLPASRLGKEFPEKEQVLIQGIIDVFFEEDGKIIVADYKTDVVKSPEELVTRYQVQLDYYGEALARLTGKEVVEKIIYSFALGKEIMVY